MHFDGTANSDVNLGALHNSAAKFWISFWFKPSATYASGTSTAWLFEKLVDGSNYYLTTISTAGRINLQKNLLGAGVKVLNSVQAEWVANTWHHVLASISDVAAMRLVVEGATAVTNVDTAAMPASANLRIGSRTTPDASGFVGQIRDVAIGTDDLTLRLNGTNTDLIAGNNVTQDVSGAKGQVVAAAAGFITVARTNATAFVNGQDVKEDADATDLLENVVLSTDEERDLLKGIIPADATEFYRLNEGHGTTAIDVGTGGNDGTIDSANRWETGLRQYARYTIN